MKYCFKILLLSFLTFFFLSCGSEQEQGVRAKTSGIYKADEKVFIEFSENFLKQEDKTPQIKANIDGKNVDLNVTYEGNKLLFSYPFKANADINANLKIANKNVRLNFKTPYLDLRQDYIKVVEGEDANSKRVRMYFIKSPQFVAVNEDAIEVKINDKSTNFAVKEYASGIFIETEDIKDVDMLKFDLELDARKMGLKKDETFSYNLALKKAEDDKLVSTAIKTDERLINIEFSQELDDKQNLKDFVSISPSLSYTASVFGNTLKLNGNFDTSSTYKVQIMQGFKAKNNAKLEKTLVFDVDFKDLEPGLSFASRGVFLPLSANKKIGIKTRNLSKIKLTVHQIQVNNLSEYLRYKNFENGMDSDADSSVALTTQRDSYYSNDGFEYVAKEVLSKEFDVVLDKNKWVSSEIQLDGLKDLTGVFTVTLQALEDGIEYNFDEEYHKDRFLYGKGKISKNLIFSNIALIAENINDKIYINARDFTSSNPLSNIKVELIDRYNKVVTSGTTNSDGELVFDKINSEEAMLLIASDTNQATILKLSNPVSLDGFDVAGVQNPGSTKAFIYTDRGVYRPGDDVHFTVVAKNDDNFVEHPIELSIHDPKGSKILDKALLNPSSDGMFYHKISLDTNALTGIYKAQLKIANNSFYEDILVQTVEPNRLKVNLSAIADENKVFYDINSSYLFGAPSANLKVKTNIRYEHKPFVNSKYTNYIFEDLANLLYANYDNQNANLDENGLYKGSFNMPSRVLNANGLLVEAVINTEVFESGGKSTKAVSKLDINKTKHFIGVKKLENSYTQSGSKLRFDVVVSDLNENLVKNKDLEYEIYQVDYSWWWDYDRFDSFLKSSKRATTSKLVHKGKLKSQDKPTSFSFDTSGHYGDMYVLIKDKNEPYVRTMQHFYVSSFGEPNKADIISSLKIKSDKKEYNIGDTAVVEFESVKDAIALVSISNDKDILQRYAVKTTDNSTKLEVKIDKTYVPNIYVSVNLIQNYETLNNDRALKLFGVVPISVKDDSTKLSLNIKAPDKIRPNDDFEVELQSSDKKPFTYTVAIVDEGLLSLTDFKTPDIWGYFYAKTGFKLKIFDTYDKIIAKLDENARAVLSTGGDKELRVDKNRDEEAQRFKPVVLFQTPVKSDDKGYAKLKFTMPSYMGSVRIMVIASSKQSLGSASKNITVSAPVVMLETLPRALRLGDEFKLLTQVFKTEDNVKSATLTVRSKNKLIKFKEDSIKVDFEHFKSKDIVFNAKVSDELIGVEEIEFELRANSYTYNNTVQIDIKPLSAFTYERESVLLNVNNSKQEFIIPDTFIKNSVKAHIKVSPRPIINIEHRLKYLLQYPYGCIEQTTSAVLPQLYLDRFSKKADKQTAINNINAAVSRFAKFQTADGGFSYWPGGNKANAYGSNYAGMFLLLAKEAGYYVPDSMLKRWIEYQKSFVSSGTQSAYTLNLKAYSLYLLALAKEPNISAMNMLYERLSELSNESKWLLAAAYKLAGIDESALKIASQTSTTPNSTFYSYTYGSSTRDKAIIAVAYNQIYGKNDANLLKDLTTQLSSNNYLSTQSMGYALYAFAQSLNIKESASENFMDATLNLDGKNIRLNQNDEQSFEFNKGKAVIESKKELFVDFIAEGFLKEAKSLADNSGTANQYIELSSKFYNANTVELSNGHFSEAALYMEDTFKSSDSIYIETAIRLKDNAPVSYLENVALTQLLPSGFEVSSNLLDKDNKLISTVQNTPELDFVDTRDDKIMWFMSLKKGKTLYLRARLNVVTPGKFIMPGTYAEAMYDNNFQAFEKARTITVHER